jgi:glyoxylase-like metal-dependent hydrolase (beta-lactamase superfamily II)
MISPGILAEGFRQAPSLTPRPMRSLLLLALFLIIAAPAQAQGSEPPVEVASPSAHDLLVAGLAALGDAAALDARQIAFAFEGVSFAGEQAHDPTERVATVQREDRFWLDRDGPRAAFESRTTFPGEITFHNYTLIDSTGVAQVDLARWRTGTDVTRAPAHAGAANLAAIGRMLPHLALRQGLDADATVGPAADLDGQPHRTAHYRDAVGNEVTLFLGATTHLLSRVEVRAGAQPPGAIVFSEYEEREGVWLPARRRQFAGDVLAQDVRLVAYEPEGGFHGERFALPAGYEEVPAPQDPQVVHLGEGVYLLDHMRPFRYRSIFVEMEDHVVVLEAPLGAAYAELALGLIRQTVPDKPIRHVLVTHHHGDHVGSVPVFAAEGASLVVGDGVDTALRRQFEALADTEIEVVTERRTLGSDARRIEILPVENDHAHGNLAFYLPGLRLLFQGDLFYTPDRGPVPPALAVSESLDRAIRAAGIEVETVIGVHGRPVTWAEFEASLAAGRAAAR